MILLISERKKRGRRMMYKPRKILSDITGEKIRFDRSKIKCPIQLGSGKLFRIRRSDAGDALEINCLIIPAL